jgi:hypothetical protein
MEKKSPALQEVPETKLIVTGIVERRCFAIGLKRDDMNIERQQDGDAQYYDPNEELAHSRSRSIKFLIRTHRRPGFLDQPRQGIHNPADSCSIQSVSGVRSGEDLSSFLSSCWAWCQNSSSRPSGLPFCSQIL